MTISPSMLGLLAQAADAAPVGSGKIQGGWEYVWGAYIVFWIALALYALSLWSRRSKAGQQGGER
jgi:hypothetical protein